MVNCTRAWRAAWSSSLSLPRDGPAREGAGRSSPPRRPPRRHLDRDHLDAVAGEDLDDVGTHGAESDHATLVKSRAMADESRRGRQPHKPVPGVTLPTPVARVPLTPVGRGVTLPTPDARQRTETPDRIGWRRASRDRPLQRRLRRAAHRPPPPGDPAARRQGGRLGARAQRRRLLQAAQLDVTAVHHGRGRARRGQAAEGVVAVWGVQHAKSEDRLTVQIHEVLHDSAHELGVDPASSRTASRRTCRGCSPSTSTPSATAGHSSAAST